MFCPKCKTLLKARGRGSRAQTYCPRCSRQPAKPAQSGWNRGDSTFGSNDNPKPEPPKPREKMTGEKHKSIPYFPFKNTRHGQEKLIKDFQKAIEKNTTLIAYAPTGIGKTVAVLAPAVRAAKEKKKTVFFLTSKQAQHEIAIETLRLIDDIYNSKLKVVDIISKKAMCPADISREHPAAFSMLCRTAQKSGKCRFFTNNNDDLVDDIHKNIMHVEELKSRGRADGVCPHKMALKATKDADVVVCDYNYIFNPDISEIIGEWTNKELDDIILIVDEAHNLPDRVRDYLNASVSLNMISDTISEVSSDRLANVLKRFRSELKKILETVPPDGEKLTTKDALLGPLEMVLNESLTGGWTLENFIKKLKKEGDETLKNGSTSTATELAEFLEGYNRDLEGLIRIISNKDGSKLYYRLLDPSSITREIFKSSYSSVLMSGTLYPTSQYAKIFGIKSPMMGNYNSSFSKENRPVYIVKGVTTQYTKRNEEMYENFGQKISKICDGVKGNVAVFFPSYSILSNVMGYIETDKEIIREHKSAGKREKMETLVTLKNHKKHNGGLLLAVMGGSLSEGIDYKENLLSSVVIVGIPFAPPSQESKALEMYYNNKFGPGYGKNYGYFAPAINKVLQAIGRCIRSESDRAIVYLMDERFLNYRPYFPEDVPLLISKNIEKEVNDFF